MTKMFKKRWLYLGCCLLIAFFTVVGAHAQTKTIKGKVVDETGQPMIGVSVLVKGTKTGTITDGDGSFTISAASKDALLFSFVGYKTDEEKVGSKTSINVTLAEDAHVLQEAVITAEFGVKRAARSVGAAIQNVKGSDIAQAGRENFINALQGRVSGVDITATSGTAGASSSIVFRAPTSISGKNSPLYVIDGIPVSNSSFDPISQTATNSSIDPRYQDYTNRGSDIDPESIESVSVLKGAAAAALYGSDASNGAIIITTKKGRSGHAKISYSNDFRFDQAYKYPKVQTKYDQGYYGTTNLVTVTRYGSAFDSGTRLYNNLGNILRTGFKQSHNVSLDAGNDMMSIRASGSLLDQNGIVPVNNYKRKNLTLSGTIQATKWLKMESSLQYMKSENHKVSKGSGGILDRTLRWPVTDNMKNYIQADGMSIKYPDNYKDIDVLNPYFDLYKNKRYDTTDRFVVTENLIISPIKDFDIRIQSGWDVASSVYTTSIHPQWTTNTTKTGTYDQSNVLESNPTLNLLASYKKNLKKFNFNGQVGYHQLENGTRTLAVYGSTFYVADMQSIANCLQSTIVNQQYTKTRRIQAISGSFEGSYDNMVFLTLRGRNDWSSTLPTANRSYFYPATDFSFIVSELPFMKKHSDTWSYIKLRGSLAQVGKDAAPQSILPALSLQTTTGSGFAYGYTGPNLALKPEMNTAWEVGLEGRMLDNRLNFDVTRYSTTSKDQIISGFRMSYATGFVLNTRNAGSFRTDGIEFSLSYDFLRSQDWTLTAGINGSHNWSKVLSLPAGLNEYYDAYSWIVDHVRGGMTVGNPITSITGTDYKRNSKGQILISPTTGLPLVDSSTYKYLGDREPKLSGGFTTDVKYKNWSLSCLMSWKIGATVVNGTKYYMLYRGLNSESVTQRERGSIVFDGVLQDGNENSANPTVNNIAVKLGNLQSYYAGNGTEVDFIERHISMLKLAQLRLGYKVESKIISRLTNNVLSGCSVYVSGSDLFMLTNYTGIDPECNGGNSSLGGVGGKGFDMLSIGTPRGISFGLNVTF